VSTLVVPPVVRPRAARRAEETSAGPGRAGGADPWPGGLDRRGCGPRRPAALRSVGSQAAVALWAARCSSAQRSSAQRSGA